MSIRQVTINRDELYTFIKQAVREALQEETLELFLKSIPSVSKEEMEDIKKLYGKPSAEEAAYSETIEL